MIKLRDVHYRSVKLEIHTHGTKQLKKLARVCFVSLVTMNIVNRCALHASVVQTTVGLSGLSR